MSSRALPGHINRPDNVAVALSARSLPLIKPSIGSAREGPRTKGLHQIEKLTFSISLRDSVALRHLAGDHCRNKWVQHLVTQASAQDTRKG